MLYVNLFFVERLIHKDTYIMAGLRKSSLIYGLNFPRAHLTAP
jgi:hypothetical protein